jgi:hypothetical protein
VLVEGGFKGFFGHDTVWLQEFVLLFVVATDEGLGACLFGEVVVLEGSPLQWLVVNSAVGDESLSDVFYDLGCPGRPRESTGVKCFLVNMPALHGSPCHSKAPKEEVVPSDGGLGINNVLFLSREDVL